VFVSHLVSITLFPAYFVGTHLRLDRVNECRKVPI